MNIERKIEYFIRGKKPEEEQKHDALDYTAGAATAENYTWDMLAEEYGATKEEILKEQGVGSSAYKIEES